MIRRNSAFVIRVDVGTKASQETLGPLEPGTPALLRCKVVLPDFRPQKLRVFCSETIPSCWWFFPWFFVGNLFETPSFRGRWSHDENTCACLVWLVELQVTKEWTGPRQVCSNAGSKKKHFKAVEHVLWEFFTTPHCNFECSNVLERVLFEKAWIFLPETHVSWPLNLALRLLWWVAHWCILDTAINVASAAEKASRMSFTSKML